MRGVVSGRRAGHSFRISQQRVRISKLECGERAGRSELRERHDRHLLVYNDLVRIHRSQFCCGLSSSPGNFVLTVNPIGNGSGTITSTPPGISCTYAGSGSPTGTCTFSFPVASTPTVKLTSATTGTVTGSVFAGWLAM